VEGLTKSFRDAIKGVGYVLRFERNARIHLVMALAVLALGILVRVSDFELAAIFFAVTIVFLAELFNSAIEKTLDIIDTRHNPQIAIVKDMAAGGVLIAAVAAMIIGVVIFLPRLESLWPR
jgi:diacylglycerol kinase (ATP)